LEKEERQPGYGDCGRFFTCSDLRVEKPRRFENMEEKGLCSAFCLEL
jgi:hypothetical protein